jgi:hypothetical protein
VTIKGLPVVSGAPPGGRHSRETEIPRLFNQSPPKVNVPRAWANSLTTAALDNFRTYFIALAAYPDTTVDYDV